MERAVMVARPDPDIGRGLPMFHQSLLLALRVWMVVAVAACSQQASSESTATSFRSFWIQFRTAALSGDSGKVAALTYFPFETRGTLDDSPVQKVGRVEFDRLLGRLLEQDPGLRPEPETMRALLERTTAVEDREVVEGGKTARLGTFVFRRVDGAWRFTRAYVEE
jgi:hypothetical protein